VTAVSSATAPDILRLLAHNERWALLSALARSDRQVNELATLTSRPQNLVSYHLGRLRAGGLVYERRSSADSRDIYYHLDLGRLDALYRAGGRALHPALAEGATKASTTLVAPIRERVLFLCTHNSARSQMAEALWREAGGAAGRTASAGSEPAGVHPLAVRVMAERGIDISRQRSKDVSSAVGQPWDVVVTVCDRVREVCPTFPAETRLIHWSIADPAAENPDNSLAAFRATADEIGARIRFLGYELARSNDDKGAL